MHKCKITILKRTIHQDLIDEYLEEDVTEQMTPCEIFRDGQEFVIEDPSAPPEGFCPWAWADIRGSIMAVTLGADFPGQKQPDVTIACCTDGYRPVIFKVERVD
jgi:uncharacterized repeat protein (TIGR04076 family)